MLSWRPLGHAIASRSGAGFDYLRLVLALLVFHVHSGAVAVGRSPVVVTASGEPRAWLSWREPAYTLIVPAFFALSGFLVSGSAFRLRHVGVFLAHRAVRIFPALGVEVALSALLLGPLLTMRSAGEYFADPQFYAYWLNILGWVHFNLPGVFLANPVPAIVNNSLWTLPAEFNCYLLIAIGMASGLFFDLRRFAAIFVAASLALALYLGLYRLGRGPGNLPVELVTYYFFAGCLMFHLRERLYVNLPLAAAALAAAYALTYTRHPMATPLFLAYGVAALGALDWPRWRWLARNDLSYGVYLYHFPICQSVIALWPALAGHLLGFRALCLFLTLAFSWASWRLIEANMLALKRRLPPAADPKPLIGAGVALS